MDRQRNAVLDALLDEYDYTHQGLADEVNRVAEDIFGKPGDCSDRHVRRWISGAVRWPWTKYLLPLERIFDRPAQALGFVPRGKASANLPRPPRPAQQEEEPVHRRRFITASAATAVAAVLGIDQTPTSGRLSMSDVDRVHERIGRVDAHFFSIGGGPLISVSTSYVARLRTALDGCTYGERVERALHGAISSLYASAGWACHDSGDPEQATLLHTASLQSALLAADPSATARAWSNLAMQARLEGRHREAVQITRAALDNRYDQDQPVGYAYGAPLPAGAPWWGGLLTEVPADVVEETGTRTYALSELMVRVPWRKTGAARQLHDALLDDRPEERATLLVDQEHPKVHALYESWGWHTLGDLRSRIPDAPLFHAMLLDLPQH
ncbi:twin-arginine translocation signal domain-containing protein [Streptomyces sp. NBC_00882]|uniref:twin-arginine translocation signal domain-containing protein n=1 Tax=Streptomyces sp. NBC_00882 TaxID=2975856 RepID=UPI00386E28C9|nr:twin-arginine translocation signal domain-containing protein [Streptomyces sp. NBC_00882]WSZ36854.1 twin-arginine translocation signal domain-containing protein [Streptomyces sp. NBC_00882]